MKNRAKRCIAQGALTNSKHWSTLIDGVYPTHIDNAGGCHVESQGVKYLDMMCGLGTNLFGYGNQSIREHLKKNLRWFGSHSLPTTLEVEIAEQLLTFFQV